MAIQQAPTPEAARNEIVNSLLEDDLTILAAIGAAYQFMTEHSNMDATPRELFLLTVSIMLHSDEKITVDRAAQIARKRSIGISADKAIDLIIEDDDFQIEAGRVQLRENLERWAECADAHFEEIREAEEAALRKLEDEDPRAYYAAMFDAEHKHDAMEAQRKARHD